MDLSPAKTPALAPACKAVALLIDGENIGATQAAECLRQAGSFGPLTVLRVYGDARKLNGWHEAPAFRLVHAHSGKNVTDMILTIEAMELAFSGAVDGFAIASNDRDFAPLAQTLRARGFPVLGLGSSKAPDWVRLSCSAFAELASPVASVTVAPVKTEVAIKLKAGPKPSPLNNAIIEILKAGPCTPIAFGKAMTERGFSKPEGCPRWQSYFVKLNGCVRVEGEGEVKRFSLAP